MGFVFFFERFKYSKSLSILSEDLKEESTKEMKVESKPQIKLYVIARKNQHSEKLVNEIDLVNIGTWGDQLSFGLRNRNWKFGRFNKKANIITIKENPGKVVRKFIDQILGNYFKVDVSKK